MSKEKKQIGDYTIEEATHLLDCRHAIGSHGRDYCMKCIILGKTKSGNYKLLVFGERNWKGKEHIKNVRYISDRAFRVHLIQKLEESSQ